MSSERGANTPPGSNVSGRRINSNAERRKPAPKETDWNLPLAALGGTRTRHGGQGRPNLSRRDELDDSSSDSDDAHETESESESDDLSEEEVHKQTPNKKSPATRVMLDVGPLTRMMDELCKCQECGGAPDIDIKTTCVASHMRATCLDPNCGHIMHSDTPAATTAHEKNDDNCNMNTDHAISVLHVLGMICNVSGWTEAARMLGLTGLPNDATMDGWSFHTNLLIRKLAEEVLLENLIDEVRLSSDNESDFETWRRSIDPGLPKTPLTPNGCCARQW